MATARQVEANRCNAQKSTGPRTDAGKRNSSLNAYVHGLTGQTLLMTEEEAEARHRFADAIVADLKPVGAMEEQLARSIADTHWRISRIVAIEDNVFASEAWHRENWAATQAAEQGVECRFDAIARAHSLMATFIDSPKRFQLLTVYEMRLHRKAQADLKQFRDTQAARRAQEEKARVESARQGDAPRPSVDTALPRPSAVPQPAEFTSPRPQNGFVCSTGVEPAHSAPAFVCGSENLPPDGPPMAEPRLA